MIILRKLANGKMLKVFRIFLQHVLHKSFTNDVDHKTIQLSMSVRIIYYIMNFINLIVGTVV